MDKLPKFVAEHTSTAIILFSGPKNLYRFSYDSFGCHHSLDLFFDSIAGACKWSSDPSRATRGSFLFLFRWGYTDGATKKVTQLRNKVRNMC